MIIEDSAPNQENEMRMFDAQRASDLIMAHEREEGIDVLAVVVYGSVAKGEADEDSDTDLCVVTNNIRASQGASLMTAWAEMLREEGFLPGGGAGQISLCTLPIKLRVL